MNKSISFSTGELPSQIPRRIHQSRIDLPYLFNALSAEGTIVISTAANVFQRLFMTARGTFVAILNIFAALHRFKGIRYRNTYSKPYSIFNIATRNG
jgi:hypothetical protein